MASFNAKMTKMTAQLEDKIRAEEQKMVPVAKLEEDLFSKIEDECIQAINKLYENPDFVGDAQSQGIQKQEAPSQSRQ